MNCLKKLSILLIIMTVLMAFIGCGKSVSDKKVIVGGKDFTEQDILVHLVSELIENKTDIEVERKSYLGGSSIVAKSIETGDLDMYVEYTGTALISVLGESVINDPDEVYNLVKKRYSDEKQIDWLKSLGFNNTFAITMKKSKAEELGIKTLSDLAEHAPNLIFASTQEFLERKDGYKSMQKVYGIEFKEAKGMDPGLCYAAVKDDKADVNVSFATDGRIPAFELFILEDDKSFFPPYYAAPIIRQDTLEKYPELEEVINLLAGKLTDSEMAKLNASVDIDHKDPKTVAKEWLKANGLID
ncbi:glycine betaine ABC transporter substrate-binding protein [Oceanirhabdus seepicola]|uniref:ABC transporter substrate-binding protein n=1 Tax=Oceanirhabdus seepicola TaxID=2828781 RepID=UPI00203254E2